MWKVLLLAIVCVLSSFLDGTCADSVTTAPIPASLFGMSVLDWSAEGAKVEISYATARTWDVYNPCLAWTCLNSQQGEFDFTGLDTFIADNPGRDILYTFGRTPNWASSNKTVPSAGGLGECAPPSDTQYWVDFVRAIATHAKGKIKYWELWNEPGYDDKEFYCGSIPQLVTLAQLAYPVLKSIDSTNVVLSPAFTGGWQPSPVNTSRGPDYMGAFLLAGGGPYFDVVSFHGYYSNIADYVVPYLIAPFKAVMAQYGISNRPMWDSETNWNVVGNPPLTETAKQAYLFKYYLLHWSNDVSRLIWYAYDVTNVNSSPLGYGTGLSVDASGTLNLAGKTWNVMQSFLINATLVGPCVQNPRYSGDDWGYESCELTKPGGIMIQVVWSTYYGFVYQAPSLYTQYTDLNGTTYTISSSGLLIGGAPLILHNLIGSTSAPASTPSASPTSNPTTRSTTPRPATSSPTSSPTSKPATLSPTIKPATSSPTSKPATANTTSLPTSSPTSLPRTRCASNIVEGNTATLNCPSPTQRIVSIDFASYGTSTGTCGSFATSSCNAATSLAVTFKVCLLQNSCSILVSDSIFGNSCSSVSRYFNVQVTCQ